MLLDSYQLFEIAGKMGIMRKNWTAPILISAIAILCVSPVLGRQGSRTFKISVARLKKDVQANFIYANDNDAAFPVAGTWMDAVTPYVQGDQTSFYSPALHDDGGSAYGYAMNVDVAGDSFTQFEDYSQVVVLFDSTDLARNATDSTSTMPSPPRYGRFNTVAYLDGHVTNEDIVPSDLSIQRVKQCVLGGLVYANDYDDHTPLAGKWMDETFPYTHSSEAYRSPAVEAVNPKAYGYALNSAVAGQSLLDIATPFNTIFIFDSTVLTKNATVPIITLPMPPRYGNKNTIGYVDGHVK